MALTENQSPPLRNPDKLFIDGRWTRPSSDRQIEVISPATEEVYVRVAAADEADINRAVEAARAAFDRGPWPRLSHAERGKYLLAIGAELDKRTANVSSIWSNE